MISNLLPYLHHHYGDIASKCFIPSAVERLTDCKWDPEAGTIIGAYDEEINLLDESDIVAQYISSKTQSTPLTSDSTTPQKQTKQTINPINLTTTAYGNDDDFISTLGNHTARKWSTGQSPSHMRSPFPIPQSISHSDKPSTTSDDRSQGSVSTLNTRINSILKANFKNCLAQWHILKICYICSPTQKAHRMRILGYWNPQADATWLAIPRNPNKSFNTRWVPCGC